jgi:hypothetical protein
MTISAAKKKASRAWDKDNMVVMACKIRKADRDKYHQAAARAGTTVNAVLKSALDDLLDKHGDKTDTPNAVNSSSTSTKIQANGAELGSSKGSKALGAQGNRDVKENK